MGHGNVWPLEEISNYSVGGVLIGCIKEQLSIHHYYMTIFSLKKINYLKAISIVFFLSSGLWLKFSCFGTVFTRLSKLFSKTAVAPAAEWAVLE